MNGFIPTALYLASFKHGPLGSFCDNIVDVCKTNETFFATIRSLAVAASVTPKFIVPCGLAWSKQEAVQSPVSRFTPPPLPLPAPLEGGAGGRGGRRRINRFYYSFCCAGLPTPSSPSPTSNPWSPAATPATSSLTAAGRAASPWFKRSSKQRVNTKAFINPGNERRDSKEIIHDRVFWFIYLFVYLLSFSLFLLRPCQTTESCV